MNSMDYNLARQKTIKLYENLGWKSIFAHIRFWDAPYEEVEKLIPEDAKVLELGCGEGLFSNFLAVSSNKRDVTGVDIDRDRIKEAYRGLKNTKFIKSDATIYSLPKSDTIVLMHLLHHLNSFEDQDRLIKKLYLALEKKGQLIIIEVEPKLSFKYLITWLTDHFLVPWLFEKRLYSPIYFRASLDWKKFLERYGFSCSIVKAEKNKPFTHVIIKCQKKS